MRKKITSNNRICQTWNVHTSIWLSVRSVQFENNSTLFYKPLVTSDSMDLFWSSIAISDCWGFVRQPLLNSSLVKRISRREWAKAVGVLPLSVAATLQGSTPTIHTLFPDCGSPNQDPEGIKWQFSGFRIITSLQDQGYHLMLHCPVTVLLNSIGCCFYPMPMAWVGGLQSHVYYFSHLGV